MCCSPGAPSPPLSQAVPEFQIQFPFKLELPDLELKSMGDLIAKTAEKRGFQLEEGVQVWSRATPVCVCTYGRITVATPPSPSYAGATAGTVA